MSEPQKRGSAALALKAGIWYVVSSFLVKAISFVTTPIFSRLMDKASYGEFTNFASWQTTLLIVVGAELFNTVNRAYYDYNDDFDGYISTITIMGVAISLTFYITALALGDVLFNIIAIPKEYIHILFFTLTFQSCKQIFLSRERTLYRYKSVAAMSVCNLIIPTGIAVFLVIMAQSSSRLGARIYGFYIPSSLIGMMCAYVMLKKSGKFDFGYCKYALKLSVPLVPSYLASHLLASSNTILTKNLLSAEAVATVSMSTSVNHILTILLNSVSGAVTTWLMDNLNLGNVKAVRKGILLYVGGITVISVGVMLVSPEVIWILGGKSYASSVILMPGMVVSAMIQAISTVFTIILTYEKKVVKTGIYTTAVCVVCILAKMKLLPVYGVEVLPYINICSFAVLTAVNYILVAKAGYAKYIDMKMILLMVAFSVGMIPLSHYLYDHTVVRYMLIGLVASGVLAAMYKYRKIIVKFINKKLRRKKNPEE